MCLSVKGINFKEADCISRGHWNRQLYVQLLVSILSYSRVLHPNRLFPRGHDLVFQVLMAGKAIYHVLPECVLESQFPG
jgi:hypothetical protein